VNGLLLADHTYHAVGTGSHLPTYPTVSKHETGQDEPNHFPRVRRSTIHHNLRYTLPGRVELKPPRRCALYGQRGRDTRWTNLTTYPQGAEKHAPQSSVRGFTVGSRRGTWTTGSFRAFYPTPTTHCTPRSSCVLGVLDLILPPPDDRFVVIAVVNERTRCGFDFAAITPLQRFLPLPVYRTRLVFHSYGTYFQKTPGRGHSPQTPHRASSSLTVTRPYIPILFTVCCSYPWYSVLVA